jgi:drug/metabolite transporter (DMT)-like permease
MVIGSLMVMNIKVSEFQFHCVGDLLFLLSAAIVVCNAFIIKMKLGSIRNETIAFYNNLVCTGCYFVAFLISKDYLSIGILRGNQKLSSVLIFMAITHILIYIPYYYSLKKLSVWIVRTVLLLLPVFTIILSRIFLGEVMKTNQVVGVSIVILGALGIILGHRKKQLAVAT